MPYLAEYRLVRDSFDVEPTWNVFLHELDFVIRHADCDKVAHRSVLGKFFAASVETADNALPFTATKHSLCTARDRFSSPKKPYCSNRGLASSWICCTALCRPCRASICFKNS